tara:strand:- start:4295 stop:4906 length:612 start_codon:yes stop_codon:yes gene_type:complete
MCIAILKPKKATIDVATLNDCWDANSHGGGFAFAMKGKLNVFKSLEKDLFIDTLMESMANHNANFLIHMRIATSGIKDMMINCHPFRIDNKNVFCHNGVIHNVNSDDDISDTRYFNKDILQQMKFNLKNKSHIKLIEGFIGNGNKLIFLNSKGEFTIANEKVGSWQNGVWFSNLNHSCDLEDDYQSWQNNLFTIKDYQKKMKL